MLREAVGTLKTTREALGLSLADIKASTGIEKSNLSRLENDPLQIRRRSDEPQGRVGEPMPEVGTPHVRDLREFVETGAACDAPDVEPRQFDALVPVWSA